MEALTTTDRARLRSFGIPDELADEAGIKRVSQSEAVALGFSPFHGRLEGVVVPRRHPITDAIRGRRLRRDRPKLDVKGKPVAKYLANKGDRSLFFPPGSASTSPTRACRLCWSRLTGQPSRWLLRPNAEGCHSCRSA